MFTGLVETMGVLSSMTRTGKSAELLVRCGLPVDELELGESIAVNGVCLTLTGWANGGLSFHALSETLNRSNLGTSIGRKVNLERALRLGDRLGGHLVSGHIDCRAEVLDIGRVEDDYELRVALPTEVAGQVVMKGSVAVNGVSLTIASLSRTDFAVRIIPHTWAETNLSELKVGEPVNLETDMLGKFVLRQLELQGDEKRSGVTMETLFKAGF
ncbi:MAG: riboflavin synthase [Lentisphaeria bacterium]|nr:riboflavin synthase [Lentisphaeria bacterium]